RLLLGTGGMGALTTFSTFSTDTLTLLREAGLVRASLNLVGNLGLGLGAAAVGFALAKLFAPSHS
ncbi:MAG: CrcB family protein, partial [Myxococcota bacterium]